MMNTLNKFALFLFLLAFSLSTYAASEAEYKKISKSYALHADGSQEFRSSMELTLFTHTAMNGTYGESFIVYNPDFQELKIHSSYTKQKDGTIVKTPENAFVEVLPRNAADAPAFNQLKEMVVVHTGLELGATIYLDYSIYTKPGYYGGLDIMERLEESSPVKEYTVTISVPEEESLRWQLYGANTKVEESRQDGMKRLSWTLKNIQAFSRESCQPANKENVPCLVASTYPAFENALTALKNSFEKAEAYETKAFAESLVENAADDKEKIGIIRKHVANNLGNCGVPLDQTGYRVRNSDDVLRSAYGTVAEKTNLLNTMLNAAGVKSEIVAIYPGTIESDACGLKAMKGLVLKVSSNGKDEYLSAVSLTEPSVRYRGELDKLFTLDGKELKVAAMSVIIEEKKEVSVDVSKKANGYVVCKLPASDKGIEGWHINPLNSKRAGIFEIPSMIKETVTYTITPQEGLELQTPLTTLQTSNPFGKVTRTIARKGNTIQVVRSIELNRQQFTPAEYKDVRALLVEWINPNHSLLLFSAE